MRRRLVGTPELMKELNRESILFFVEEQGPISQADISRRLNISRATVSGITRELMSQGILRQAGKAAAVAGRRPTLLELNPGARTAVAVDLSQSLPVAAVVDLGGRIMYKETGSDLRRIHGEDAFREFLRFLERFMGEAKERSRSVCGIGVAVPGITATASGVVHSSAGLGWYNLGLAQAVSEVTSLPARIDNDVNLAALGEMWKGAAGDVKNLVMVQVADGIGAAIIIDGQVYRGADDAAGEIGHMILDDSRLGEDFTEWGWLEVQAAEHFVAKRVAKGQARMKAEAGILGELGEAGREYEIAMHEAAKWVSMAICNIVACLNPDLCLVGGSLVTDGWIDVEKVALLARRTIPTTPRIRHGSLGADASLIGAAAEVFQSLRLVQI